MGGIRKVGPLVAVILVLAVGGIAVGRMATVERTPTSEPDGPDLVLKKGEFEGMPWTFGMSGIGEGEPCISLDMAAVGDGCGLFPGRIGHLKFYTSSGGHPSGIRTAEGFASERVAHVLMLSAGRPVGEVHLVDLPQPVGGKKRAVVVFVTEEELGAREWVAVAFDARNRVVGRDVPP